MSPPSVSWVTKPGAPSSALQGTTSRWVKTGFVMIALTFTNSARAGGPRSRVAEAAAKVRHWFEVGQASWYGQAVQGHLTASGERFNMNAMTCAHRTLPLGTWLRVTNLKNSRSVLVQVIDRGPLSSARVVDLSYAAAHAVGIGGVGQVRLEPLNPSDPAVLSGMAAKMAQSLVPNFGSPAGQKQALP